jgi:hypothetical protein
MLLDPYLACRQISESRLISLIQNDTNERSVLGAFQTKKQGALKIAQTLVESQYYLDFFKERHDTPKLTKADHDEIARLKLAFDTTRSAAVVAAAHSNAGSGNSGAAVGVAPTAAGVGSLPPPRTRKSRSRFRRKSRRERRSTKY